MREGATSRKGAALRREAASDGGAVLVVVDPIGNGDDDTAVRAIRGWLDPAVAALLRGEIHALAVIGDAGDGVKRWSAAPPSLLARLRARLRPAARRS